MLARTVYIHAVLDRIFRDFPAKSLYTHHTVYIYIWFWPTLYICVCKTQLACVPPHQPILFREWGCIRQPKATETGFTHNTHTHTHAHTHTHKYSHNPSCPINVVQEWGIRPRNCTQTQMMLPSYLIQRVGQLQPSGNRLNRPCFSVSYRGWGCIRHDGLG